MVPREFILSVLAAFLSNTAVLALLPGRLAIIDPDRVRLRPAPPLSEP